jgi:hypothetical protein
MQTASRTTIADRGRKNVYCLVEGIGEEVWHWTPGARIMGVFSQLCNKRRIGRQCFLAQGIPVGFEIDELAEDVPRTGAADAGQPGVIDGMAFHRAQNEAEATHEIIVMHRNDVENLKAEANACLRSPKSLRDRMVAELWMEMAAFIQAEPQQTVFIFAREL